MAMSIRNLDESTFAVTFDRGFTSILTTVTSRGSDVKSWLKTVSCVYRRYLGHLVVGLDAEWRPNTSYDQSPNPVAVLQLCVGKHCLIFQILHADYIPNKLCEFLKDDRFTFVGVGIDDDAQKLYDEHKLQVKNKSDLKMLAAEKTGKSNLRNAGLQKLAQEVMGINIKKSLDVRTGAWDAKCLSEDQILYACFDTFTSFEIGRLLISGSGSKRAQPKKLTAADEIVSFSDKDLEGITVPNDDLLFLSVIIADKVVNGLGVSTGTNVNILYLGAYLKLGLGVGQLKPCSFAISSIFGNVTDPLGTIHMLVTVGEKPKQRTIPAKFVVVDYDSPICNGIIGKPFLGELGAVASMEHLKIKFPTSHGTGEARGDQAFARKVGNVVLTTFVVPK